MKRALSREQNQVSYVKNFAECKIEQCVWDIKYSDVWLRGGIVWTFLWFVTDISELILWSLKVAGPCHVRSMKKIFIWFIL
jgi:hypothetical protein